MIDISSLITKNNIVEKHMNYINKESEIQEKLEILKSNITVKILKNNFNLINNTVFKDRVYSNKNRGYYNKISGKKVTKELKKMINFFIDESKNVDLTATNIFISTPNELDLINAMLKKKYKRTYKYLQLEREYLDSKVEESKKIKFSIIDNFNVAFGYKKFTDYTLPTIPYMKMLKMFKSYSCSYSYIDELQNGKRYASKMNRMIIESIVKFFVKYSVSKVINDLHETIITELNNLDKDKLNKTQLVHAINNCVEKQYEKCEIASKNLDVTIDNFKILYSDQIFNNSPIRWSGYHYLMALGIRTCPYCNRQYITPAFNNEYNIVRGDLDHFYPKSKYPYFSMSLYNLIPSCKFCNSSLKSTKEFTNKTHINPFAGGFEGYATFKFEHRPYINNDENIDIYLEYIVTEDEEKQRFIERIKANAKVFKIENLYSYHDKEVSRLIERKTKITDIYKSEVVRMVNILSDEEITEEQIDDISESIYGLHRYNPDDNDSENPLSKFRRDILNQLIEEND